MLELWQTEWCPQSRRIRQRLTELGIDYVLHQVPVEKSERHVLRAATGCETIPVLVHGSAIVTGEDSIRRYLDRQVPEPACAEAHRLNAEKARRRYLEEECACLQPATH